MTASLKRIGALIVKELHQVVRDPGNVGIAVILPAVLLLLFGYGMSMDIKNVRIAYLAVPASSHSTDLETRLTLSRYFQTTRVFSTREAEEKLRTHEADAFIALQSNAPDTLHNGITKVQIVVNGVNANQATLIRNYLQAVVGSWASSLGGRTAPVLDVQTRTRFNEANDSHYYLVPGVIVTIMTMIAGKPLRHARGQRRNPDGQGSHQLPAGHGQPGHLHDFRRLRLRHPHPRLPHAAAGGLRLVPDCGSWAGAGHLQRRLKPVPGLPVRHHGHLHAGAHALRLPV